MCKVRNVYRILVEKPLGKCPHGRQKKWVDNNEMDLISYLLLFIQQ
jgi:hypothetical protein